MSCLEKTTKRKSREYKSTKLNASRKCLEMDVHKKKAWGRVEKIDNLRLRLFTCVHNFLREGATKTGVEDNRSASLLDSLLEGLTPYLTTVVICSRSNMDAIRGQRQLGW